MHTPRATQTQFSLRSLLILTTVFAMLFAFLTALGVSPQHALTGFVVLGTTVAAVAVAIELTYRVLRLR